MRIESLEILNAPPVERFEVAGLADVVVIAGPNGVGKTRLLSRIMDVLRANPSRPRFRQSSKAFAQTPLASVVIKSTSDAEKSAWGKPELNLSDPADMGLFQAILQSHKSRTKWQSSILQFESDRTIQNVQPLAFTWNIADPTEESIGWDFGFNSCTDRWKDTLHSIFRLVEHQKQDIANHALQLRREGHEKMDLSFADPMQPFKEVFSQLLGPKELVDPSAERQALEFTNGQGTFNISHLSSGEREVVNIAFDFLLRRPSDCIIFFDEPELHLHPEVSHRLIRVLQGIGERNQFILSTHSPDIISASLDKSVVFISPPRQEDGMAGNQALLVSEDDDTNQALKLLGHSIGVISLGKKIVLIEGKDSSLDKETYGALIHGRYPELVLVPSGGKHTIESFEVIQSAILQKSLWGVEFFMLCDRDSMPAGSASNNTEARFRVLSKYHLENYFLDEVVLAEAFSSLERPTSWLRDPAQIREAMRKLAESLFSYSVALSVAADIRREAGNISIMPRDCHRLPLVDVTAQLHVKSSGETARLNSILEPAHINQLATNYHEKLRRSLASDDDDWLALIPGKSLFAQFSSKANIRTDRLKMLYLNAVPNTEREPFQDIIEIFGHFASI
jgi:predicted ATP-binding protein involved in virulence